MTGLRKLQQLYALFGPRTVFLPVQAETKKCFREEWQNTIWETTQQPDYQLKLINGGVAVLFGPENLAGLDCDTEERVTEFLELNPQVSQTLQTRGARGRTFHFRIRGNYPKLLCKLKTTDGQKIGEWRGADGYTVVSGIHPDTGESYKILVEKPPLLIDWITLTWPAHWNVPWQPKTAETGTAGTPDGDLSRRILAYLAGCPSAISGNGGHSQTLKVATQLVIGFALGVDGAMPYLREYNRKCVPPWSEKELLHKAQEADKNKLGREPGAKIRDDEQKIGGKNHQGASHDNQKKTPAEQDAEREAAFSAAVVQGAQLLEINIPPKKIIIDDWYKEGDLGFVFAYRGTGKTWLILQLCIAIADGGKCGPWQVGGKWPVLYVDGEMSHNDDRERISGLQSKIPDDLYLLNHEILFHRSQLVLNLGNRTDQEIITKVCLEKGIKVLVLDNLGCLFSGVGENDADEWEKILPWLLTLRRHAISVIIVHHSGHDSTRMRGTVKREDSAAWVLRLDDQRGDYTEAGARFISRFKKLRGQKPAPDYEWRFEPQSTGTLVTFKEANRADIVLQWVMDGLTSCSAIAKEMGLSEGMVSRIATKLIKDGKLTKKNREYVIP
jgi:hypothetical protein